MSGWQEGPRGPVGGYGTAGQWGDERAFMGDLGTTSDMMLTTTNASTAVYTSAASILNK